MEIVTVFAGVLLTTGAGFAIIHCVTPGLRFVEKAALGYGIGFAAVTLLLFWLSLAGVPLSAETGMGSLVILIAACLGFSRWRDFPRRAPRGPGLPGERRSRPGIAAGVILAGMTALLSLYVLADSLYWPVSSYDAMHFYDNLARLFFSQRSALLGPGDAAHFNALQHRYPLHVPLMHCWLYLLAGNPGVNPKFLHALYYLSLLIIFYCRARRHVTRNTALLGTLALASAPGAVVPISWAETSFVFLYYLAVGVIYLCDAVDSADRRLFVVGALFLSILLWIRPASELIFLSVFAVMAAATFRRWKLSAPLMLLGAGAAGYLPYAVYSGFAMRAGAAGGGLAPRYGTFLKAGYLPFILRQVILRFGMMSPGSSGIIWPAFTAAGAVGLATRKDLRLLLACIASLLVAYCLTFYMAGALLDFDDRWWGMLGPEGSADRLIIIFQPLMLYFITLLAGGSAARPRPNPLAVPSREETDPAEARV